MTNLWLAPGLIEGRGVQGAAEALAGASAAGLAWSALMDGARKVDWLSLRERASRLFSVSRAETTWMAGYYALAKAATMATQIAAGRMLGPEEFGRANVILAGAAFLQTIPMLGFPASVARSVAAADARERPAALSTSTGLFALWTLASLPMLWLLRDPVSRLIGLPHEFWPEAFALAALTAAYTVLAAGLLGHRRLRSRGAVELLYGLAVPVIFFATGNFKDHRGYMLAIAAALALGALVSAIRLRRSFGGVELKEVKPIFAYALVAALNYLATALVLAPGRLHLGAVSGSEQVGAFSAYFSATMQIALAVSTLASSALLPMATGRENQQLARTRISEQWLPGWLVSFAGFTAAGGAALALFGSDYPMRAGLLVLFGAAAATHLLQSLVSTVLAASGLRGLAFAVAANVSAGAVNALACPFLIARYGLAGAALALLLGFVVGSGICAAGKALTRE